MSQTYVLDTSALLNLIRGRELGEQIDKAFGLRQALYRHTISIVTHGELKAMAQRRSWGDEKQRVLTSALDELVTVDISNNSVIDAYVMVENACRTTVGGERRMGQNDMWIAATAVVAGLPLITTDDDFNHLNRRLITVHWIDPKIGKP